MRTERKSFQRIFLAKRLGKLPRVSICLFFGGGKWTRARKTGEREQTKRRRDDEIERNTSSLKGKEARCAACENETTAIASESTRRIQFSALRNPRVPPSKNLRDHQPGIHRILTTRKHKQHLRVSRTTPPDERISTISSGCPVLFLRLTFIYYFRFLSIL